MKESYLGAACQMGDCNASDGAFHEQINRKPEAGKLKVPRASCNSRRGYPPQTPCGAANTTPLYQPPSQYRLV